MADEDDEVYVDSAGIEWRRPKDRRVHNGYGELLRQIATKGQEEERGG